MNQSARLSILHIHTLPVVSGSGINTLLTMMGSRDCGHDVALACSSPGRLTEEARKAGMAVYLIPHLAREIHPGRDLAAVMALRKLIRRHRFALVHTHNSKAGIVGRLGARQAGVATVIHTVHGFAFHDAEAPWWRVLYRSLERIASSWCDGMIFVSQPLAEWADRERIGLRVPKAVIYSGIDAHAFQSADGRKFRQEHKISVNRLVVGMVSKLWEGKGHDILLDAWKEVLEGNTVKPDPLLILVGEGHLDKALQSRATELNLDDSVLFTGFRDDIPAVTAAMDVAVLPSLFEGMGRAVLEAMAAAKPVVASRVGGIPDLVTHGTNGLLVQPGDRGSLARALLEILSDASLRSRLGRAALTGFRAEYSAAYMVDQIHRFYEQVRTCRSDASRGRPARTSV